MKKISEAFAWILLDQLSSLANAENLLKIGVENEAVVDPNWCTYVYSMY